MTRQTRLRQLGGTQKVLMVKRIHRSLYNLMKRKQYMQIAIYYLFDKENIKAKAYTT